MSHSAEIKSLEAHIIENVDVGGECLKLVINAPLVAATTRAGNFAMLRAARTSDPLLGRPLAIMDADAKTGQLTFLIKRIGRGTNLIADLKAGAKIRISGPMGNHWTPKDTPHAILIAGGTGLAALTTLNKNLLEANVNVDFLWGAQTKAMLPRAESYEEIASNLKIATDDGSVGFAGNAVQFASELIQEGKTTIYAAGPIPMMKAAFELAEKRGVMCYVSLEARMACGFGVCRGCVINAKTPHPKTGLLRRGVCSDGPVFNARTLDWDNLTC